MKHNFKRFLSLLLALVMVLGMMPMGHARAASAPESGKTYLIVHTRSGKLLTNQNTNGNNGLLLDGTLDDIANATIWTIEGSDGVYTVKDSAGNYLKVSDSNATVSSESATVSIGVNGSTWTINYDGYYLNQFGGGDSVRAAGWKDGSAAGDSGSQWTLYEYVPVNLQTGETHEIDVDGDFESVTGNEVVSVDANFVQNIVRQAAEKPITSVEELGDGGIFVIRSHGNKGNRYVSNNFVDDFDSDNTGLELVDAVSEKTYWIITKTTDGYTISDGTSNINITGEGRVSLAVDAVVQINHVSGDNWDISNNGQYLNAYDSIGINTNNGNAASSWRDGGATDDGSKWRLYKVEAVPEVSYTPVKATHAEGLESGKSYLIVNANNSANVLVSTKKGDNLSVSSGASVSSFDSTAIWTLDGTVGDDGAFEGKVMAGENQCLIFGDGGYSRLVEDASIRIEKGSKFTDAWRVKNNGTYLNPQNGEAKTYGDANDNGNHWHLYEVTAEPVGSTTITFTGLQAGTTDITIGNTVYAFTVTEASESQLTTAAQLNDGSFVALEECEYTLGGTEDNYSLCHAGTYYIQHRAGGNAKRHQTTTASALLKLDWNDYNEGGKVAIKQNTDGAYIYFHYDSENPTWNAYGSKDGNNTALYLFYADENSTNEEIPGYTMATSASVNESYLIAAKNSAGNWYVMVPTVSTTDAAHIAQVVATEEEPHDHAFGEWTVVTDPTCTVTGTKTQSCDCGHVHTEVIAIDPEAHTAGDPVVENETAASYDQVVYCTECNTELSRETISLLTDKVVISTIDVSLDAEIMLKYGVIIPEELIEGGAYIVLTKDGGYGTVTKEFKGEELAACKSDDKYVVAIGVASGEMNSPVKIEVFNGQGTALNLFKKDGTALGADTSSTVVDFAERVLTNEKNGADKKNLAVALVTYGGYAQKNFNTNPENPAYGLLDKLSIEQLDLSGITAESLAAYTNSQSNTEMGVKATGISTFVDSYIYIRVFLAVEGDISAYTFTLATPTGNVTIEPVFDESTNRYYVDIPDIASAYIDYKYSITVTKGEESNVISTSVLSYARSVLKNSQNSEEKKNLVRALYLYNQAANTFFND